MNLKYLSVLRCPKTGEALECLAEESIGGRVKSGSLRSVQSGNSYPIVNFIPRFVPVENYASNFGLEWNIHSRTQYDGTSGHDFSRKRFVEEARWPARLEGEVILEVGSGSGRFTELALETGATVVSLDYSYAVEANYASNGAHENLLLVQASVFEMPLARHFFDRAFCFGVLQHTPDPKQAFFCIRKFVKDGGWVAVDIYLKDFFRYVLPFKYWVRPFTRGRDPQKLYDGVKRYVDFMWPLAKVLRRIPVIGPTLNWKLLIGDYSQYLQDADDATLKRWAYLDTFDMLSPMYDIPETVSGLRRWYERAGFADIDVHRGYNGVEGRGRVVLAKP